MSHLTRALDRPRTTTPRPSDLPVDVARAVARYETASMRVDELSARPASGLSPAEFNSLADAQRMVDESVATLKEAGRLDLIAPAVTASCYRHAVSHCRELASDADYDGCLAAQDEMAMRLRQLRTAGRLDLIEAS